MATLRETGGVMSVAFGALSCITIPTFTVSFVFRVRSGNFRRRSRINCLNMQKWGKCAASEIN